MFLCNLHGNLRCILHVSDFISTVVSKNAAGKMIWYMTHHHLPSVGNSFGKMLLVIRVIFQNLNQDG